MKQIKFILRYIKHIFTARCSYGFGIHSPFVYHFTKFVIYEKNPFYIFPLIEARREELKNDQRTIDVTDFGTGKSGKRKVSVIARNSLKHPRCAQLLYRISNYLKPDIILELGTSLGITTSYLAAANKNSNCITMEGCPETAKIAQETFEALGLNNIQLITGDINKQLPALLKKTEKPDLIFIDANHSYEAVLKYFEECATHIHDKSVVIIDDIHWSKGMEKAWNEIIKQPRITASIDIFHMGIIFFDSGLAKKHYKLRI